MNHNVISRYLTGHRLYSLLVSLFLLMLNTSFAQRLLIGTYTKGKSEGLYMYRFDTAAASASFVSVTGTFNPSFVAVDPFGRFAYAVNENNEGSITSYSIEAEDLNYINQQPTKGAHPCYAAVHPSGKWVTAGNYSGGNFSVYSINSKGQLSAPLQTIQYSGKGSNLNRQEKPHVHATMFTAEGKQLLVSDLGLDKVNIYQFSARKGKMKLKGSIKLSPGSGPRHIALHNNGKILYVLNELTGNVAAFEQPAKTWQLKQEISTLPSDYKGSIGAADIHLSPDGKFLYCSNRGDANSLAIFSVTVDGELKLIGFQPVLGMKPRNFSIHPSGKFLLVANQDSDEIVIFRRNLITGLLADTGNRIIVGSPVCITWINEAY